MKKKSIKEVERKRPAYYINDEVASPEYTLYLMFQTYKMYPKSRPRYEKIWPVEDVEIIKQKLAHEEELKNRKKNYNSYIRSDKWKQKRNEFIKKYKVCACCGSNENLNVHHLSYDNLGNESDEDLLLLCSRCHKYVHKGKIKIFYMNDEQIEAFDKISDIIGDVFMEFLYGYIIIKK